MNAAERITDYITRNRVSTTEVADALGKAGVLPGVLPLSTDHHRVGRVRCVFTANASNRAVHEQIRDVREGDVVMVFTHACEDRAVLGDLVAKFVLLYRKAAALIVDGLVRDAARLRRERYPVWARGVTPLGCFNTPAPGFPADAERDLRRRFDGGVATCDDGGVTVIPADRLNDDTLERLERIELQEDLWYFCLNTLKWDTEKIVCAKAYLTEPDVLPAAYRDNLNRLKSALDAPPGDGGK